MYIQYFAYEIDTHDTATVAKILAAKAGGDPRDVAEEDYFTLQVNLLRDVLRDRVVPVWRSLREDLRKDTLPVFVVPEFYFKYVDGKPYSRATVFNKIEEYLKPISGAFPDVLIVAGTIWWGEPADPGMIIVHNTLPVLRGGKLLHTWQKTRLSAIDGLDKRDSGKKDDDRTEVWDRWEEENGRILDRTQSPFMQLDTPDGPLAIGLEICLDHLTLTDRVTMAITDHGVLRTLYLGAHTSYDEGPGVDVHILVAAGMEAQSENITARHGGLYLRCDGGLNAERSQCLHVERAGDTSAHALRAWNPTWSVVAPQYLPGALGKPDLNDRVAAYGPVEIVRST